MERFKKTLSPILLVLLCVVSILSFLRIGDLESRVIYMNHTLDLLQNEQMNLSADLRGQIQSALEEEASILAAYSYKVGDFDPQTLTAPVYLSITPKYQQEDTTVQLQINDVRIDMNRNGASYEATVDLALNETLRFPVVVITSDGAQSVQELPWSVSPLEYGKLLVVEFIPPQVTLMPGVKIEDAIRVVVSHMERTEVSQVELVTELDGVEQRRDLCQINEDATGVTSALVTPEDYAFDLQKGSELRLYADVTADGLVWRFAVCGFRCDENGNISQMDIWEPMPVSVTNPEGRIVDLSDENLREYGISIDAVRAEDKPAA